MDNVHATVVTSVDAMAETIIVRLDLVEDTEPVVLADQVSSAPESISQNTTVLPAKSDSDVMFCLQRYQGLRIERSFVY